MSSNTKRLDFSARYQWSRFKGIAFYLVGYKQVPTEEYGEFDEDREIVIGVMVGDDFKHEIPVEELTEISEGGFCLECGQIGCMHGR